MNMNAIFFVHGIGVSEDKLQTLRFISDIYSNIKHKGKNTIKSINWSSLVEDRQKFAYKSMEGNLKKSFLRKIKHSLGSDILWYARNKEKVGFFYNVNELIKNEVNSILQKFGEKTKLVFIGHSWGTQIIYENLFDIDHPIESFITMGSPMGAVSGRFNDWGRIPKNLKSWVNFYSTHDFISSCFKNHPNKDIAEFVENIEVKNYNPFNWLILRAHSSYFESKTVKEEIVRIIDNLK